MAVETRTVVTWGPSIVFESGERWDMKTTIVHCDLWVDVKPYGMVNFGHATMYSERVITPPSA